MKVFHVTITNTTQSNKGALIHFKRVDTFQCEAETARDAIIKTRRTINGSCAFCETTSRVDEALENAREVIGCGSIDAVEIVPK